MTDEKDDAAIFLEGQARSLIARKLNATQIIALRQIRYDGAFKSNVFFQTQRNLWCWALVRARGDSGGLFELTARGINVLEMAETRYVHRHIVNELRA